MILSTIIMGILAFLLVGIGYFKGGGEHLKGLSLAIKMTLEILPLLIFAFLIAGMVQVLIPKEWISKWIGEESGLKGILIGTIAGGLTPGGPYISLPIAVGLWRTGGSVGTVVAFVTGWSLWAIGRLPIEVGIMGWRFAVVRFLSTFLFPPIAGLLANFIYRILK